MSGGSADQGVQPRILTHRNLGPNSYSLNSVTLGRHLTYKNLGLLVFQKKKKTRTYCSQSKGLLQCG